MNTAQSANAPRTTTLGGEPFTVSALRMADWGAVQAWILDNVPGPLAQVKASGVAADLSPYELRTLMSVAIDKQQGWPPKPGTSEWFGALDRTGKDGADGNVVFLRAVLARHHPEITAARAADLAAAATGPETNRLIVLAFGREPDDPKASSGAAAGTAPASSGSTPTTSAPPTTTS